jgi:phosphate starvation-inducible PhoH-like protein
MRILRNIEGIAVHSFSERDVVRHRLVQKIILAYEKYERERASEPPKSYRARRETEN